MPVKRTKKYVPAEPPAPAAKRTRKSALEPKDPNVPPAAGSSREPKSVAQASLEDDTMSVDSDDGGQTDDDVKKPKGKDASTKPKPKPKGKPGPSNLNRTTTADRLMLASLMTLIAQNEAVIELQLQQLNLNREGPPVTRPAKAPIQEYLESLNFNIPEKEDD